MPTQCNPELFDFPAVAGRRVEAASDGGAVTSDAGALLLGATDRVITLVSRFAACFQDHRCPELIEHEVATLVGQRVFGMTAVPEAMASCRRAAPGPFGVPTMTLDRALDFIVHEPAFRIHA